ncbi:hypothetical protein SHKM778_63710 [Streptomyces sp. KM77-8]|uniref:ABC transporter permease n=1 Tax=Streptomyces haneummycinicus TaxID=3074435 RepID=A0AAT9HQY2_9ACTN
MTWSEMQPLLEQACTETLIMVGWSTVIAVVGGLPLGILLVLTDKGGLLQNALVNKVIGQIVNIGRSLPFIILMVALMNFTRWVTGTTIGSEAAIVPLAIGGIPSSPASSRPPYARSTTGSSKPYRPWAATPGRSSARSSSPRPCPR